MLNATDKQALKADILANYAGQLEVLQAQRDALRTALVGENRVVRTYGGLYVGRNDRGYYPTGLQHCVRWTAADAEAMAEHWNTCVDQPTPAIVVSLHEALDTEIANLASLAATIAAL